MKVYVYIDGFNLYYRALRETPGAKWLDLGRFSDLLLSSHDVQKINYFTSRIKARGSEESVIRQNTYLRALRTISRLTIHFGYFAEHVEQRCELATPIGSVTHVDIIRTTEKGSDVNLATELLVDASAQRFEAAAVVTNDSDLCMPIKMVRDYFKLPVLVLDPSQKGGESKELKRVATSYRQIRMGPVLGSQFPEVLHDKHGAITRPREWAAPETAPGKQGPEKS